MSGRGAVPRRLVEHLANWLGDWPDSSITEKHTGVIIVGHEARLHPGWDGHVHDVIGVATTTFAVLSVPPHAARELGEAVATGSLAGDLDLLRIAVPKALGRPGSVGLGLFRWSDSPTATPDVGEWVPADDPRVPDWLRPFNGDLLIAWDGGGAYGAGVGRKQHDAFGHELSVGTEPSLRGRGIGRHLVATAARRVLAEGAIPTYLHAPDNHASARVADAAGFPDIGWRIVGFWGR